MKTAGYLLSTNKRVKVLNTVLYRAGPNSVRRVGKELKLSPGFVSTILSKLRQSNILSRGNNPNQKNPLTKAIKILLNIENLSRSNLIEKAKKVYGKNFVSIGVYGSFAKGTNTFDSDLDLWVKLKKSASLKATSQFLSSVQSSINLEVNLEILDPQRLSDLRSRDKLYYDALLFGSMILYGDGIES